MTRSRHASQVSTHCPLTPTYYHLSIISLLRPNMGRLWHIWPRLRCCCLWSSHFSLWSSIGDSHQGRKRTQVSPPETSTYFSPRTYIQCKYSLIYTLLKAHQRRKWQRGRQIYTSVIHGFLTFSFIYHVLMASAILERAVQQKGCIRRDGRLGIHNMCYKRQWILTHLWLIIEWCPLDAHWIKWGQGLTTPSQIKRLWVESFICKVW